MTDERAALAARHRPEPIGSDPDNEVDAGDWFADERATLITTEAGKRLHDARHLPDYCSDPCELREEVAAIEAEARAAERARLREGVEGLFAVYRPSAPPSSPSWRAVTTDD